MLPTTTLPKKAKLTPLFDYQTAHDVVGIVHPTFEEVYQDNLWFERRQAKKPILYASFVTSIDGKIAFPDQPQGPLIARENHVDATGAALDWWLLNALRTSSDAIIFGVNTLQQEAELTGHVYDVDLQQIRQDQNQPLIPWNLIITHHAEHIPFQHRTFTQQEIPVIIITVAEQAAACQAALQAVGREVIALNSDDTISLDPTKTYLISRLDEGMESILEQLAACGLEKILVESPTLTHTFLEQQLLDELFINQSGLYVGGDALGLGQKQAAFTSQQHPHTKLLSIHQHDQTFLYFRYQIIYGK